MTEEIEHLMASMSEEELRARGDAALVGQIKIMQAAIASLIAVSPKPDYIQFTLAQAMASLKNAEPDHPAADWAPAAILAGATPVADNFIRACQANLGAASGG